ncbi:MAG: response regulator, partial [Chloroflexota bacterium]|nr:response regulator [Chloroflexota bacterium]
MDGGLVLVVDDSVVNRKLLERALRNEGHDSLLASDGREALALLAEPRDRPIDVVLLDLVMPGLDGFGTLERIKA